MQDKDRKPEKKRHIMRTVLCMFALAGCLAAGVGGTKAYLTHKPAGIHNNFTVGNVDIAIKEEFTKPSSMPVGTTQYKKSVTFKNEGSVDAYARVAFAFSSTDVANISRISGDGGITWHTLSDYRTHLPAGWQYKQSGTLSGYYYYTRPLAPGESTPALFTHVKTSFEEKIADTDQSINRTPRDYDIYIYAEGLQQMKLDGSGKNTNYEKAWTDFLKLK